MKFIIDRTTCSTNERPCKEAKQEMITCAHFRTKPVEYMKQHFPNEDWTGFYNCPGGCKKDYKKSRWVMEFNTLEELLDFRKKYGELVICSDIYYSDLYVIEIYDSYRE